MSVEKFLIGYFIFVALAYVYLEVTNRKPPVHWPKYRHTGKPAPKSWQLQTQQSKASNGDGWARCYHCPSLHNCGQIEMCDEEVPGRWKRIALLLSKSTTSPAAKGGV